MTDVYPIYEALWRKAKVEFGAHVHYTGRAPGGEAGYFHPHEDEKRPHEITIYRPYYENSTEPGRERTAGAPLPPPDLEAELITLAHECGHLRSWQGETPRGEWVKYSEVAKRWDQIGADVRAGFPDGITDAAADGLIREALSTQLCDDDKERIVREEELAWQIGRELLRQLGFGSFGTFDERAKLGVHNYRYRLGIDELWAEDLAAPG